MSGPQRRHGLSLMLGTLALIQGVILQSAARFVAPGSGPLPAPATLGAVFVVLGIAITTGSMAVRFWRDARVATSVRRLLPLAAIVGVLALGASAMVAVLAPSTARSPSRAQHEGIDWTAASATDLRVAALFATARDNGLGAAMDGLEALVAEDASVEPAAHQIAHALARFAVAENGYDVAAVAGCRPIFHSGCYHGALEAWFGNRPDAGPDEVRRACGSALESGASGMAHLECAHGVGHGLVAAAGHDLVRAVTLCDALAGRAAESCHSGAFMENAMNAVRESAVTTTGPVGPGAMAAPTMAHAHGAHPVETGPHPEHMRRNDPDYPCSSFEARYAGACWMYQPFIMMSLIGLTPAATLQACDAAPGIAAACYTGFGTQVAGGNLENQREVYRLCGLGSADRLGDCIAGAAEYIMDITWTLERALPFCADAPEPARDACFRRLGERLGVIHEDIADRAAACATAATLDHVRACHAGAGLEPPKGS
ncbi:MAG: hypothetical protein L0271_12610 [Gemmatimonadetes bacterium]|nr:hypothetical protein [Gemmatimonadota bacterium]